MVNLFPPPAEKNPRQERELSALINTASEVTWIDRPCINRLQLKPTDSDSVPWFNGERIGVDLFNVNIQVLGLDTHELVDVACTDLSFMECQVILGRNVLQYYEFYYSGPTGEVRLRRPT